MSCCVNGRTSIQILVGSLREQWVFESGIITSDLRKMYAIEVCLIPYAYTSIKRTTQSNPCFWHWFPACRSQLFGYTFKSCLNVISVFASITHVGSEVQIPTTLWEILISSPILID